MTSVKPTSSTSPDSNSSIQARLATLFPTIGSNRASGKSTSRRPARSKQTIKATKGRPSKTLVYKDLVLIPSPKINKVPTHTTRLQLEERELVCHEFPFDKSWDAHSLKAAILNRFPKLLLFEYVKLLAEGITLDAERVTRMAGQGAVYVRLMVPLESEDKGETEEELENSLLDDSPSVNGAQRSSVFLSFGESDGRPDAAVVPHPCPTLLCTISNWSRNIKSKYRVK
ncbi:uncharacterized protein LOC111322788 [Stylophora pistillata]|uniref:uncharacterized protein LOC111322788 n=1 Tax=Stylophora pistillata TaxID=50429 RepID=UPI000C041F0A|nr:uncharacterized protein LOC111322788 [Stylophora pistillata]